MLRVWHAFGSVGFRALSSIVDHTLRSQEKCLRFDVRSVERIALSRVSRNQQVMKPTPLGIERCRNL